MQATKQIRRKMIPAVISMVLAVSLLIGCGAGQEQAGVSSVTESTAESSSVDAASEASGADNSGENSGNEDNSAISDIYVEAIPDLSDDFIRGMDASSVLAEENSGVVYYNFEGEEQDVFQTLAEAGINYIRLRVWNDPYDEEGNGYGGGNNDLATAIELGKRATSCGMKVCIDFHYSDFWADPKRQHAPKAWADMDIDEKTEALYDYTTDSLTQLLDAGVDVGMVQIGNEINNGMSGETEVSAVMQLLDAGSRAVREISETCGQDIQIAVHYTNIDDEGEIATHAAELAEYGIDYDVFGLSYYPFWDGTNENMQAVAALIQENYGKQVMIAETSYCYTLEDGDGTGNSFASADELVEGYGATVQSQATMIRDICAAANEAGVIGVFYWEGVWIPVGEADYDANFPVWEKYGSGWASSYAADYDPEDAGKYYGGCSWDNQAMFDFDGYPLASLKVFGYLKDGNEAEPAVDYIPDVYYTGNVGSEPSLPETVPVIYSNRSLNQETAVIWNAEQLNSIDTSINGTYEISGVTEDGDSVTCHVEIKSINLVTNPSFEEYTDAHTAPGWTVTYTGDENPTDFQVHSDDATTGEVSFHFYSAENAMEFQIEQTINGLEPGTYQLTVNAQGYDASGDAEAYLFASSNGGEEQTASYTLTGWAEWKTPTIEITLEESGSISLGVRIKCAAQSWGSVDDFTLIQLSD